jgi:exosome complex component CSL4
MTERKIVYPGDEVGEAEEFLAGPGTYVEDHKILSAQIGELVFDSKEFMVYVKPAKPMNEVQNRDIVVATVDDLKSSMVTLDIRRIEGKDREVMGETHAAIHVAKISHDYVRELDDVMRITDVVRAKVIQAAPSIQLETRDDDLGVIKALCEYCRTPMVRKDRRLWCDECERYEDRKISNRYGMEHSPGVEHMLPTTKGG